jgi:two-component system chemotaxis response regulator CheY
MALDPILPVLVVDDHGTMIRIVRGLLRRIGFADVDEANSGGEALTKLCVRRYGLIISDWHMEPVTGYDLLRAVRSDPGLKQIPFILVTGESRTENVIAARRAGVNGYIVKPFNEAILKAKIEAIFATRAAPVAERPAVVVSRSQGSRDAPVAAPASDTHQLIFPGRFTSDS